jgi:hypothetical protein
MFTVISPNLRQVFLPGILRQGRLCFLRGNRDEDEGHSEASTRLSAVLP